MIALLDTYDGDWVNEAASRGVFAYIVDSRPEELQSAIDITLRRFAEYQHLQGAFDRRNAETVRATERTQAQQRQLLELHDGVVQALSVAHLALELDRPRRIAGSAARGAREHPHDRQQSRSTTWDDKEYRSAS